MAAAATEEDLPISSSSLSRQQHHLKIRTDSICNRMAIAANQSTQTTQDLIKQELLQRKQPAGGPGRERRPTLAPSAHIFKNTAKRADQVFKKAQAASRNEKAKGGKYFIPRHPDVQSTTPFPGVVVGYPSSSLKIRILDVDRLSVAELHQNLMYNMVRSLPAEICVKIIGRLGLFRDNQSQLSYERLLNDLAAGKGTRGWAGDPAKSNRLNHGHQPKSLKGRNGFAHLLSIHGPLLVALMSRSYQTISIPFMVDYVRRYGEFSRGFIVNLIDKHNQPRFFDFVRYQKHGGVRPLSPLITRPWALESYVKLLPKCTANNFMFTQLCRRRQVTQPSMPNGGLAHLLPNGHAHNATTTTAAAAAAAAATSLIEDDIHHHNGDKVVTGQVGQRFRNLSRTAENLVQIWKTPKLPPKNHQRPPTLDFLLALHHRHGTLRGDHAAADELGADQHQVHNHATTRRTIDPALPDPLLWTTLDTTTDIDTTTDTTIDTEPLLPNRDGSTNQESLQTNVRPRQQPQESLRFAMQSTKVAPNSFPALPPSSTSSASLLSNDDDQPRALLDPADIHPKTYRSVAQRGWAELDGHFSPRFWKSRWRGQRTSFRFKGREFAALQPNDVGFNHTGGVGWTQVSNQSELNPKNQPLRRYTKHKIQRQRKNRRKVMEQITVAQVLSRRYRLRTTSTSELKPP